MMFKLLIFLYVLTFCLCSVSSRNDKVYHKSKDILPLLFSDFDKIYDTNFDSSRIARKNDNFQSARSIVLEEKDLSNRILYYGKKSKYDKKYHGKGKKHSKKYGKGKGHSNKHSGKKKDIDWLFSMHFEDVDLLSFSYNYGGLFQDEEESSVVEKAAPIVPVVTDKVIVEKVEDIIKEFFIEEKEETKEKKTNKKQEKKDKKQEKKDKKQEKKKNDILVAPELVLTLMEEEKKQVDEKGTVTCRERNENEDIRIMELRYEYIIESSSDVVSEVEEAMLQVLSNELCQVDTVLALVTDQKNSTTCVPKNNPDNTCQVYEAEVTIVVSDNASMLELRERFQSALQTLISAVQFFNIQGLEAIEVRDPQAATVASEFKKASTPQVASLSPAAKTMISFASIFTALAAFAVFRKRRSRFLLLNDVDSSYPNKSGADSSDSFTTEPSQDTPKRSNANPFGLRSISENSYEGVEISSVSDIGGEPVYVKSLDKSYTTQNVHQCTSSACATCALDRDDIKIAQTTPKANFKSSNKHLSKIFREI